MIDQIIIELIVSLSIFIIGILVGQARSIRKFFKRISDKRYAKRTGKLKLEISDYEVIDKVIEEYKKTGSFTMGEARDVIEAAANLEKQGKKIDDPEQELLLKEITDGIMKLKKYFNK